MTLVKWNRPSDEMPVFSRMLENFFNEDSDLFSQKYTKRVPAINVKENDDNYMIEVAAPGLNKKDFNIDLDNDIITIEATKESKNEKDEEGYTRREFCYDAFTRSFTLPESIDRDKIDAKYNDGVLNITLPKKEEAKAKPARKIKIG